MRKLTEGIIDRLTDAPRTQQWPARPGSTRYRVSVRQARTRDVIATLRELDEPCCRLDPKWFATGAIELRVEAADLAANGDVGEYSTWLPYFVPEALAPATVLVESEQTPDGFPTRIIVRPERGDEILLDQARIDGRFALDAVLSGRSVVRYKFMRYEHTSKKWQDVGGYVRLNTRQRAPATQLSPSAAWRLPSAEPAVAPFLFTCDVEVNLRYQRLPNLRTAVDEHVFGLTPGCSGKQYGINYLMDALERHQMKGTFFVDVLMLYQVGEPELRRAVDAILTRGHDVQLHLHPNPNLYYAADAALRALGQEYARTRSLASFERSLALGCEIFSRVVGAQPLAFRNGSYALADEYFEVIARHGIRFDSSLYSFKNCDVQPWMKARSSAFRAPSGVVELPVTWVVLRDGSTTRVRQHTIHLGPDAARIDQAISELWRGASAPVVMVTHSYSLLGEQRDLPMLDQEAWDEQLKASSSEFVFNLTRLGNREARKVTMDGPHLERVASLERRLALVASTPNARAMTFAELSQLPVEQLLHSHATDPVVEVDVKAGSSRITGMRRYDASYLRHLDRHG